MAEKQTKKPNQTAKKKQSASKNSTKSKQPQKKEISPESKRQTTAIIMMAVSVFVLCVAFIKGQSVWLEMHNGLYGIFGFCTFIVPFALIYFAIVYARGKNEEGKSSAANAIGIGFLFVLFSGALHVFVNTNEYFSATPLAAQLTDTWANRPSLLSGGVFGTLIGGLVANLFGKAGAVVTFIILIVAVLMLLTGTSIGTLAALIRKPVKKVTEITGEKMEQNAQKREQLAAEREAEKAKQKEKEGKKAFVPPAKPTVSADNFEDNYVTDESTFDTYSEPAMPDIPVIKLPNEDNDPVEEIIAQAVEEESFAPPAPPSPVVEEYEDIYSDSSDNEDDDCEESVEEFELEFEDVPAEYVFPSIDCLRLAEKDSSTDNMTEMQIGAKKLIATLESFKIRAEITNICRGPSVTRYELVPDAGVRINKITNLADDIALRLAATSVRIEAPIPGKSAIGIEIPNSAKSMVTMRETIDTPQFRDAKSKLNVALGKDITGNIICADLAKMPHLLVAGTTGSGKSVCLNAMIVSILYNASPEEVKLVMIDPKMVEFTNYNGIAHLEVPVVSNPRKAAGALSWAVGEMEKRYQLFAENGIRDIKGFNALCESRTDLKKIPQIVIFIDELADLMMVSPKEVEDSICRLAQKARAAGIHLVIATQRPSVDVITGLIKANIPSRIALSVSSPTDSRIILDAMGAEKLLGNGDMLFCPIGSSKSLRVQGCYISEEEVENVVSFIKSQAQTTYNEETIKEIESKAAEAENAKSKFADDDGDDEYDPILNEAIEVVVTQGGASTTMLQKKLKLGYARASRVMDQLQEKGIVGPPDGAKPRAVLITQQQWYEMQALAEGAGAPPSIDDVFADDDDFSGSDF